MKPKEYQLMEECIENGVKYGHMRAYKYSDTPTNEMVVDAIIKAVLSEIYERWEFDTKDME